MAVHDRSLSTPDPANREPAEGRSTVLGRQFGRYLGVAAAGFAVDVTVLTLLTASGTTHLVAAAIGFLAGLAVTGGLSERYAFADPRIAHPLARHACFVAIGLVGLVLMSVVIWLLVDVRGLSLLDGKVIATAVVFAWNFLARRAMYRGVAAAGVPRVQAGSK